MKQPHLYSEAVQPIDVDEAGMVHVRAYPDDVDAFDCGDSIQPFAAMVGLAVYALLVGVVIGALAVSFAGM